MAPHLLATAPHIPELARGRATQGVQLAKELAAALARTAVAGNADEAATQVKTAVLSDAAHAQDIQANTLTMIQPQCLGECRTTAIS